MDAGEWAEFGHVTERKRFYNFLDVRKEIEDQTNRVAGESKGIVATPISITIFSYRVPDLLLVDLPGLVKVSCARTGCSCVRAACLRVYKRPHTHTHTHTRPPVCVRACALALQTPQGDQPADIERQVRDIWFNYVSKPDTIILAITAATQDIVSCDAIKMALEVDPQGERTIGTCATRTHTHTPRTRMRSYIYVCVCSRLAACVRALQVC